MIVYTGTADAFSKLAGINKKIENAANRKTLFIFLPFFLYKPFSYAQIKEVMRLFNYNPKQILNLEIKNF